MKNPADRAAAADGNAIAVLSVQNVNMDAEGRMTDLSKENPKLEPAPDSNTAKPPEPPAGDLTKAQASKLIDELKSELGR
jgi:hypothetical protein